jgi:uncharacterized membrane protein YhaH (DUF805 family)
MLSLLFGFHGRINRAKYWFGSLLIGFCGFFGAGLLLAVSSGAAFGADTKDQKLAIAAAAMLLLAPVFALMIWASLAVQVKRLHDRGRSGWVAAAPLAVAAPMLATALNGALNKETVLDLAASLQPYSAVLSLINLGFFIDLGCLPGKRGPNRFGDPPGLTGISTPQQGPLVLDAPTASAAGMQAAMERAIAQLDAGDAPAAWKPTPAPVPRYAGAPAIAAAKPAVRGFGRRVPR